MKYVRFLFIFVFVTSISGLAITVYSESNNTEVSTSTEVFSRDLFFGVSGNDVKVLQEKLGVTPVSGFFGPLTKEAVLKYQVSKGIRPSSGYFGSITRNSINGGIDKVVVLRLPSIFVSSTTPTEREIIAGNENGNVNAVPVLNFVIKGGSEDVILDRLIISSEKMGVATSSDFYLAGENGDIISSATNFSTSSLSSFDDLGLKVLKNKNIYFKVLADFIGATTTDTFFKISVGGEGAGGLNSKGEVFKIPGIAESETIHLYKQGPIISVSNGNNFSDMFVSSEFDSDVSSTLVKNFDITVTAKGGEIFIPKNKAFSFEVSGGTKSLTFYGSYMKPKGNIIEENNSYQIPDGESAIFNVTFLVNSLDKPDFDKEKIKIVWGASDISTNNVSSYIIEE